MSKIDLKNTKFKLAIMFALIVFCVSFLLEISYFTIRYYNFKYYEKKDFNQITQEFNRQFNNNPVLFNLFLTEWVKFRLNHRDNDFWKQKPEDNRWFKFINFIILDNFWNVIAQNLWQNIDFKLSFDKFKYNEIFTIDWWFILKKIDISWLWWDYKDIIFIKKQNYSLEYYFKDIFFFFVVTLLFSVLFYYVWIFFVNKNLKPVEDTFNDMNDFIHNANHELKTPISVINSNLQLIKATKNYEEDLINSSINEIKRIDNLILELSNISDINSIWEIDELNLQKEIEEILSEYKKIIDGKKLKIDFKINKNIMLKSNKNYFYILFSNLLRNAIKYNIDFWEINIILDKNKLSISNTWNWISNENLPFIFDRFFKGEKSRNSEWFGIWLSLVKKICDVYNWKISVSSDEKITTFEIKF